MLSERLHQARLANGLSLRALAEEVGVSSPELPRTRSREHELSVPILDHPVDLVEKIRHHLDFIDHNDRRDSLESLTKQPRPAGVLGKDFILE